MSKTSDSSDQKVFPVKVEYEAYILPTPAFFIFAMGGTGIVFMIIGTFLPKGFPFMFFCVAAGFLGSALWILHLRRVHTQRKIITDDEGITYVKFAGESKFIRWTDISQFKSFDGSSSESPTFCSIYVKGKEKLRIEPDYDGYGAIIEIARKQLPDRFERIED